MSLSFTNPNPSDNRKLILRLYSSKKYSSEIFNIVKQVHTRDLTNPNINVEIQDSQLHTATVAWIRSKACALLLS